ncbi:CLUMA_CG015163, isoform A [Clunio marinus]|uniref:CLUMA_CG015163, isoform A n=1 Tax=Clunio marinus TaxID=568069 RepID=A0A1J1IV29_9DIPT|nr:CLUMA_CG015163, isoform A [Clunio marinus]
MNDSKSYPTPSLHVLTPEEIVLVKDSWKIPSANAVDSAELIFYTFLSRYPEHQKRFVRFKDKPLNELKGSPFFRAHASRIYNVFDSVIDGIGKDPENKEVMSFIAESGIFHAKKKVTKQAHAELRVVLVEILNDVCKLDEKGNVAWSKLLDIFYHVMFECIDGRSEQFNY